MAEILVTYLVMQCAAVSTHWVPISAAPQTYWFKELISAACQHHSPCSPSSPPTTRACLAVPFTPQTYLLNTGARIVLDRVDDISVAKKECLSYYLQRFVRKYLLVPIGSTFDVDGG